MHSSWEKIHYFYTVNVSGIYIPFHWNKEGHNSLQTSTPSPLFMGYNFFREQFPSFSLGANTTEGRQDWKKGKEWGDSLAGCFIERPSVTTRFVPYFPFSFSSLGSLELQAMTEHHHEERLLILILSVNSLHSFLSTDVSLSNFQNCIQFWTSIKLSG